MTELHEDIINKTGIGNIKDYTPKYRFIIPYFDIATWHDYMEENFKSIDAIINYIFEIKKYRGKWKQLTKVYVDEVYFIDDNEDPLNGRLVKVLIEHTTDDTAHFSDYYNKHQSYYEIFDDASSTQIYAQEAKEARDAAEIYCNSTQQLKHDVEGLKYQTEIYKINANSSANNAQLYMNNAEIYKNSAQTAKTDAQKASVLAQLSSIILNDVIINTQSWISNSTDEDISNEFKDIYKYKSEFNKQLTINSITQIDTTNTTGLIMFNANDVITGNYSQVAKISINYLEDQNKYQINGTIYAKEIPLNDIILSRVICYVKGEINNE